PLTTQRVAPQEPASGQPATLPCPESFDRFRRVRRTAGHEPARRRQPRRDALLVEPDQVEDDPCPATRSSHPSNSRFNSSYDAPYASRLALTNRSSATPLSRRPGSTTRRKISRSRRLTRFLATTSCL